MTGPLVDLAGRHAVVTGAASGLGRAVLPVDGGNLALNAGGTIGE